MSAPAAAFLSDPLRLAVLTAHLAQDDLERARERARERNYLYAVTRGDPKEAHAMLRRAFHAAGLEAGPTTTVTTEILVRQDPYFGPATLPEDA